MKNKPFLKNLIILLFIGFCFISTACETAVRCDYDYPFENVEWKEITKDEAIEIWNTYDTKRVTYKKCNVKTNNTGSQQLWKNCKIVGDSYETAQIQIILYFIEATAITENFSDDSKYYVTDSNSKLVRIKGTPANAEKGENWYRDCIYSRGWLVEEMFYRSYADRTYTYVQYIK